MDSPSNGRDCNPTVQAVCRPILQTNDYGIVTSLLF